jgi:hypothetical protein
VVGKGSTDKQPSSTVSYVTTLQSQLRTFLPLSDGYEEFTLSPLLGKIWPWLVVRYVYPVVYTLCRKSAIVYVLRVPLIGWLCRYVQIRLAWWSNHPRGEVEAHRLEWGV